MKSAALLAFATLLASSAAALAAPAPVAFDPSPDAAARRIVNVVFAEYLQQRVGVNVETAVIDLDSDGTGEILARFVHTGSCLADMKTCRTVVLEHRNRQGWKIVYDQPTAAVAFEKENQGVPSPLVMDGLTWKWGASRYEPDGNTLGKDVAFSDVPSASVDSYAVAFGEGARKLAAGGYGVKFRYSGDAVGKDTLVVSMNGKVVCGDVTGCPVRILAKDGKTWKPVLSTSSKGRIAVSDTVRGGYHDVVMQTGLGYAVYGWNGNGYSIAKRVEAVKGE